MGLKETEPKKKLEWWKKILIVASVIAAAMVAFAMGIFEVILK